MGYYLDAVREKYVASRAESLAGLGCAGAADVSVAVGVDWGVFVWIVAKCRAFDGADCVLDDSGNIGRNRAPGGGVRAGLAGVLAGNVGGGYDAFGCGFE